MLARNRAGTVTLLAATLIFGACSDPEPAATSASSDAVDAAASTDTSPSTDTTAGTDTSPGTDTSNAKWTTGCPADAPAHIQLSDVGELKTMHVACQGDKGPGVLLLHGFPEFWYGWHRVMKELAPTHQVVAPDQRGYNKTSVPTGLDAYHLDKLVADTVALIDRLTDPKTGTMQAGKITLVGHDWGGALAWVVAHKHPKRIGKLVIINGPHPDVFAREYNNNPAQKDAASYMALFRTPGIEGALAANDYKLLLGGFGTSLSEADKALYRAAYTTSGLTGMLAWYRANLDTEKGEMTAKNVTIDVPTLVVWGMKDTALLYGNTVGLSKWVKDLTQQQLPTATHWVSHDQPVALAKAIADFTAGLPIPATGTEG